MNWKWEEKVWVAPDAGGNYPTPDALKALEVHIKFLLDIEMRKTVFVYLNDIGICSTIISLCPNILTNSAQFYNFRQFAKTAFRAAKHEFLYQDFLVSKTTVITTRSIANVVPRAG